MDEQQFDVTCPDCGGIKGMSHVGYSLNGRVVSCNSCGCLWYMKELNDCWSKKRRGEE